MKGTDLIVDAAGNVLMITSTFSTDFPLFPATLQPSNGGGEDACIIKLTGAGVPLWSTYIGGSGTEKLDGMRAESSPAPFNSSMPGRSRISSSAKWSRNFSVVP